MIEAAIELISTRFNILYDIVKEHGHDLQPDFAKAHKKWQLRLTKLH